MQRMPPRHYSIAAPLLTFALAWACPSLTAAPTAAAKIDFAAEIQPILSRHCYACHGPDKQKAGLRLDQRADALLPADSDEPAIVPGKPALSRLLKVIDGSDKELTMPPKGGKPTREQVALIRKWIEEGAEYNMHWSFVAPKRAALPEIKDVKLRSWPRNAIDHFVLARLQKEGLTPSPEADPYTLVRRVYLDLIGIPPTPEEADAFVKAFVGWAPPISADGVKKVGGAHPTPDPYEALVDRLLASPHYGERWARRWLDLARYADTNGYEKDRVRTIWPYRDWVIKAINDDMPFDQFTIEQIAGDVLESFEFRVPSSELKGKASPATTAHSATRNSQLGTRNSMSPLIATGFHRNTMINEEGGIDVEEFRYHAVVDRVNTTAAVWLGLTVGCAQCHTHKYDPITHQEYFQLFAFLNNADEPEAEIVSEEMIRKREEIAATVRQLEASLESHFSPSNTSELEWFALAPAAAAAASGRKLTVSADHTVLAATGGDAKDTYTITAATDLADIAAIRLEALTDPSLPKAGPGLALNGNFVLGEVSLTAAPKDKPKAAAAVALRGAETDVSQTNFDVTQAIDGDPATGWAIDDGSGAMNKPRSAVFHFSEPLPNKAGTRLVVTLAQPYGSNHILGKFRLSVGRRKTIAAVVASEKHRQQHLDAAVQKWIDAQMPDVRRWSPLSPTKMTGSKGGTFVLEPDQAVLVNGDNPNQNVYTVEAATPLDTITAIRLEVLPDESLPNGGPGRAPLFSDGDFHLGEFRLAAAANTAGAAMAPISFREASHSFAQAGRSAQQAIDGDPDTAWSIKGGVGKAHQAVFVLKEPLRHAKGFKLKVDLDQRYIHQMTIGKFRLSVTGAALPVKAKTLPSEIETLLALPQSQWSEDQRATVRRHFLLTTPLLSKQQREIEHLRASTPSGPKTMVMAERDAKNARTTHIHKRGEFLQPGDPVTPGIPGILHPLPTLAPPRALTRLDLARWLVDKNNPLVGRVVMNRQWHAFFGRGLVRTVEDFGLQGEQPSHRELLDWLAVEFAEGSSEFRVPSFESKRNQAPEPALSETRNPGPGTRNPSVFSMKHMHKLIVMSATYRQSSRLTPQLLERDPQNILLARGPRFRIEAEMIRDSALASSGLLSRRIGGPSVFPPQPDGVTALGYGGFNWATATGENRYRRGLYTFAKRTTPYAAFTTFDGPTGDTCLVRRDRSNTPLQALTMMNDTVFVEAAQAMAKRVLLTPLPLREGRGEGKAPDESLTANESDKATRLLRLVLTRPPAKSEVDAIVQFVATQRDRFAKKELDAVKVAGTVPQGVDANELAAWTVAARGVMNLDEAVTKE